MRISGLWLSLWVYWTEQEERPRPCVMSFYHCVKLWRTRGKHVLWNGACLLVLVVLSDWKSCPLSTDGAIRLCYSQQTLGLLSTTCSHSQTVGFSILTIDSMMWQMIVNRSLPTLRMVTDSIMVGETARVGAPWVRAALTSSRFVYGVWWYIFKYKIWSTILSDAFCTQLHNTYVHTYIHTYIHTHTHIHTYIHIYIHTYIFIQHTHARTCAYKICKKPLLQTLSTTNLHISPSYVALPNRFCLKYANNKNGTPIVFLCTAYERAFRLLGSLMYSLYLHKRKMLFFDPSCVHVMVYKILIAVRWKYMNNQLYYFASTLDKCNTVLLVCRCGRSVCRHDLLFDCMRAIVNSLVWRNVKTCGF